MGEGAGAAAVAAARFVPVRPLTRALPAGPRRTLADIIMEKITEKQTEVETALSEISGCPMPQLDPRVLDVYRGVREVRAKLLSPTATTSVPTLPQRGCTHPRSAQVLLWIICSLCSIGH